MNPMLSQDSRILDLSDWVSESQAATVLSKDKASLAVVVREGSLGEVPIKQETGEKHCRQREQHLRRVVGPSQERPEWPGRACPEPKLTGHILSR